MRQTYIPSRPTRCPAPEVRRTYISARIYIHCINGTCVDLGRRGDGTRKAEVRFARTPDFLALRQLSCSRACKSLPTASDGAGNVCSETNTVATYFNKQVSTANLGATGDLPGKPGLPGTGSAPWASSRTSPKRLFSGHDTRQPSLRLASWTACTMDPASFLRRGTRAVQCIHLHGGGGSSLWLTARSIHRPPRRLLSTCSSILVISRV